jgi:hypothetical protein
MHKIEVSLYSSNPLNECNLLFFDLTRKASSKLNSANVDELRQLPQQRELGQANTSSQ